MMIIVIFCFLALEDRFQLLSEDKEVNADIKFVLTGPQPTYLNSNPHLSVTSSDVYTETT